MYSFPFSLTTSVRVRGMSMSTVLIAPNSGSMDSLAGSTYLPPTIRPARGSPFSFFRTSTSVDSGSEEDLSSLSGLEGATVEFLREGAATEFFLEVGGTAEFLLVPTNEFALELAKKLVGLEAEGDPRGRGEPGLELGAEKEGI
ncbi:hypothetical protein HG531_008691 [Fusarium graminearum]|nr:hypothetical protein HG531_008691 [Fusarium graminearum]